MVTPSRRRGAIAPAITVALSLVIAACSVASPSPSPSSPADSPGASQAAASGTVSPASTGGSDIDCLAGSITTSGSTALQPLVDKAAKDYVAACPEAAINVQGGGSGTGLTQVLQGAVEIGASDVTADSKLQPADASQLVDHVIARQGWIMVANPSVTGVTNLTTAQARDIWTGTVTNWKDVGGPDQPIVLIIRPASSGTRATFKQIVLGGANEATGQTLTEDSNGAVTTAVVQTPGSTSVIGFPYYQQNKDQLSGLQLDGIEATIDDLKNGTYKLQAFGHLYTKGQPTGLTKAFLDYLASPTVQDQTLPSLFFAAAGSD
ncbi:MAG TPA: phosphate ABC transporter substrate-binding protein [Candidatus Limnocylindrales bacterium]|nr:phosphate ABC transporter substrate-binding protein [Candidatus Limnocylindrales bacterium]